MEHLWAPWRMSFISPETPPPTGCIFCVQPAKQRDDEHYILYRGKHCFMMLNLYPYNNGHVMIAPYQHIGQLERLDAETLADMMGQAQLAIRALQAKMKPDGFNMGINQGRVAGAGFADHIHYHIVPRWTGDVNFMPTIADVKVMPELLASVYAKLKQAIAEIQAEQEA
ncbi:MAG: HIT domain-containing protein [Ktedonobacteraceae bacterium]|nr:HIT domain-containing protein [Ktedonobacteraceae bacterium]